MTGYATPLDCGLGLEIEQGGHVHCSAISLSKVQVLPHIDHSYLPSWSSQAAAQDWELDEEDMLVIEATYEGAKAQPTTDVFVWERGGAW